MDSAKLIDPLGDEVLFPRIIVAALAAAKVSKDREKKQHAIESGHIEIGVETDNGLAYFVIRTLDHDEICRVSQLDVVGFTESTN